MSRKLELSAARKPRSDARMLRNDRIQCKAVSECNALKKRGENNDKSCAAALQYVNQGLLRSLISVVQLQILYCFVRQVGECV